MKAVFVGADSAIAEMVHLSIRFRWPDGSVVVAKTGSAGIEAVAQESPEVAIIRPDLPDMPLSQVIAELRRFSNVPLMVLSREGTTTEAITALELGADDYVRLPCALMELMVRIWALLRRFGFQVSFNQEQPLNSGELSINLATKEISLGGKTISLTYSEFRLLYLLVRNAGMVVSRQILERALWGDKPGNPELLKKYIQRLRRKLGDDAANPRWISNVKGVGYRFVNTVTPTQPVTLDPP